jgi:hypothetical protein
MAIIMQDTFEIENIEAARLAEGIDDVDLRSEIGRLRVGDLVNLTLLSGTSSFETISVQITNINAACFRGRVAKKPKSSILSRIPVGLLVTFTRDHIHSIANKRSG